MRDSLRQVKQHGEGKTMNDNKMIIEQIKTDIKTVIDYLWNDEKRHYEEDNEPQNHIFCVLNRLKDVVE